MNKSSKDLWAKPSIERLPVNAVTKDGAYTQVTEGVFVASGAFGEGSGGFS